MAAARHVLLSLATARLVIADESACMRTTRMLSSGSNVSGALAEWTADMASPVAERACSAAPALAGIALMRSKQFERGIQLLKQALAEKPDDWVSASFLGAAYELMARKIASSDTPLAGALSAEQPPPRAGYSKALAAAISYFQQALHDRTRWEKRKRAGSGSSDASLPQALLAQPLTLLYRSLGTCLLWAGKEAEARDVFTVGAREVGWPSAWCRPNEPHAQVPWAGGPVFGGAGHPRGALGGLLAAFEAAIPGIRDEFQAVLLKGAATAGAAVAADGSVSRVTVSPAALDAAGWMTRSSGFVPEEAGLADGLTWQVFPLAVNGELDPGRCAVMPTACALLASTPLAQVADGQAKISVLPPGAYIRPHSGPTDARLRVHCTLAVAGRAVAELRVGQLPWLPWTPGVCFAFDESCEHEVRLRDVVSDRGRDDIATAIARAASEPSLYQLNNWSPWQWPVRAVFIVDIANPFLEPLETFQKVSVSAEGWARFGPQLRETWRRMREPEESD